MRTLVRKGCMTKRLAYVRRPALVMINHGSTPEGVWISNGSTLSPFLVYQFLNTDHCLPI